MIEVLLCHAREDTAVADAIASRLERCSEANVSREEISSEPASSVGAIFSRELPYSGVVLLLSPDAVPPTRADKAWRPVLKHLESRVDPPIAPVVVRDCEFPNVLTRKEAYNCRDQAGGLRDLQAWALDLDKDQPPRTFLAAELQWAIPPKRQIEQLARLLVDKPGAALLSGEQATRIAQQFAYETHPFFRDVIWIGCGDRPLEFITGELAYKLGIPAHDSVENTFEASAATAAAHRLLLILLEAPNEFSRLKLPDGMGSVLITRTGPEAISESPLPRIDAGPADIRWSDSPKTDEEQMLLEAAAICNPFGFTRDLVLTIAGMPHAGAVAFDGLISRRLIDQLDETHLRLNAAGAYEPPDRLRAAHAQVLTAAYTSSKRNSRPRNDYMGEIETALLWALDNDWNLSKQIAVHAGRFLKEQKRLLEASWVFSQLQKAAEDSDEDTRAMCSFELRFLPGSEGQQYASRTRPGGESMQMAFVF
jgi:hypothetical protein